MLRLSWKINLINVSFQSLIDEKDSVIDNLRSDLEVSKNKKLELNGFLADLKSLAKEAEEKSCLWLDGWMDDTILGSFFQFIIVILNTAYLNRF